MTMAPLRRDPRSWTIEDDEVAEATLRAVELLGLVFAEVTLHRISRLNLEPTDPDFDLSLRALGTVSGRVAMTRLAHLLGTDQYGRKVAGSDPTDIDLAVGQRIRLVLNWLFAWSPTEPDAPPQLRPPAPPPPSVRLALDELWAALIYLDRRARARGTAGPGRARRIIREHTPRKV